MWGVEGHVKVCSLWRHFYQGTNGLIYVVNSNDQKQVVDAQEELNKLIEDAMRDTVVVAFANTSTPCTATCSEKKLTSGHKDKDLWLGCADCAGDDSVITGSQGQSPTSGAGHGPADMGCADMGCGDGRGNGKMVGGGGVPPPAK